MYSDIHTVLVAVLNVVYTVYVNGL